MEVLDQTALAIREDAAPLALFGTNNPVEVIEVAARVATALADVVNKRQLYAIVNQKKFPTVEAWTLLGSMLGVFPITEWVHELRNEDGSVRGFEARVRAQTLTGRVVGAGEARCVRGESATWGNNAKEYALASMAQTRATSKALRGPLDFVFKLAGFQPTPAEEMPEAVHPATGEIKSANASQESREALESAGDDVIPAPNIAGNSPASEIATPVVQSVEAAMATANGKRRGRPMGSKNGPKDEQGTPSERSGTSGSPPLAPAKTSAPPAAFGEETPETLRNTLRRELRDHASRLRKYQYMEQDRDVLPLEQWQREVERTLAIFIERKFGTDVRITDIEEAGLREAIADLKGYIAKYEAPADDDDVSVGEEGGDAGTIEPPTASGSSSSPDTTVVSLHKPIVRNPVAAQRRDDPTHIDPRVALDRARLVADLRNRTTALLATKEGLVNLSAKDEERLRGEAEKTMERAAQGSFQQSIKDLDNAQLTSLVDRAKAAGRG